MDVCWDTRSATGPASRSAQVVDTFPFDGGEVELVVVRLDGAFGGKRMLAVEDLWMRRLRAAHAVLRVAGRGLAARFARDATRPTIPYRARSYWRFEEPARTFAAA